MIKCVENIQQVNQLEASSDIAGVKMGTGGKHLVVSFTSNSPEDKRWFHFKGTLNTLRKQHDDAFDVLFVRDHDRWYLERLPGVSDDIDGTARFLQEQTNGYSRVAFVGCSAGGFASLLYGSLLNVHTTVALNPQTDLVYCESWYKMKTGNECLPSRYVDLLPVMSANSTTTHYVYYTLEKYVNGLRDRLLHGPHHYDHIKHLDTVKLIPESLAHEKLHSREFGGVVNRYVERMLKS
jgi:hypothetical protein